MQLQNFDVDLFLSEYWQKKPLLIKNPWGRWTNPMEADDLAGLACEEEVESRIILNDAGKWALEHGPFAEERFAGLGAAPWTLLVQAVDHYVTPVADLLGAFRFIPNWRVDDVMVSYASDGGGVGPHYDQYDVFLVQGAGKRRWRLGGACDESSALLPHDDLRLLAQFEAQSEYILEAGDILYVPPGIAHDGVGIGDDCMTYSIGFRAPSHTELLSDYCDHLIEGMDDDIRYSDPNLPHQANSGEISPGAIDRLHNMIVEKMQDRENFARWFGAHNSMPKYPDMDWAAEDEISLDMMKERIASGLSLRRNPASRFSFIRGKGATCTFFADGQAYDCQADAANFAQIICSADIAEIPKNLEGNPAAMQLAVTLYNRGCLIFDDGDMAAEQI